MSLALDGYSKSTQTDRYSMVCSTFAQVQIFGITPFPHTVVPPILVQTPFKCFHIDQQITAASDECLATSVSVSCVFLPVLSCECDYTWVRNLLHSFSRLMVVAYQYSVCCIFDQPYTCCLAATSGVWYSTLSKDAWLAKTYLEDCPSFFVFIYLSRARLASSAWKKWCFSMMSETCVEDALMNVENNIVFLFPNVSNLWSPVISVMVFSVFHQSNFSHQYDNIIAYRSCYTDKDVQEVNT